MSQRLFQQFDDLAAGGAPAEEGAGGAERAERKARNRAKTAAGNVREEAQTAAETARRQARRAVTGVQEAAHDLGDQAQTWAEEARLQGAAAARAAERAVDDVRRGIDETTGRRPFRTAEGAAVKIGQTIGRLRYVRAEDVVSHVKRFVGQHPSSLVGAAVAGFLFGRAMRR